MTQAQRMVDLSFWVVLVFQLPFLALHLHSGQYGAAFSTLLFCVATVVYVMWIKQHRMALESSQRMLEMTLRANKVLNEALVSHQKQDSAQ